MSEPGQLYRRNHTSTKRPFPCYTGWMLPAPINLRVSSSHLKMACSPPVTKIKYVPGGLSASISALAHLLLVFFPE